MSATKMLYNWPDEKFLVPEEVKEHLRCQMTRRGGAQRKAWEELLVTYAQSYPVEADMLRHITDGTLPEGWDRHLRSFEPSAKGLATRQSSGECLNDVARGLPWLLGGSADLGPSCLTTLKQEGAGDFLPPCTGWGSFAGRNMHFGIREHAMGAIMNGLALCGLRPFGSTFFVFCDYMKPPIRMAAIMKIPCIWIFTHDSIGVGEDGPTHQPIEQISSLRSIPRLLVFRPCDANEVAEMWKHVITLVEEPAALVLSRQALPTLDRSKYTSATGLHRGAYVLAGESPEECAAPDVILMASGSEVHTMLEAHEQLMSKGVRVRSLSVPCLGLFKTQPDEYIKSLLPDECRARVSIEAGRRDQWGSLTGLDGEHVGLASFGASAPFKDVAAQKGLTTGSVLDAVKRVMAGTPKNIVSRAPGGKRRRVCA